MESRRIQILLIFYENPVIPVPGADCNRKRATPGILSGQPRGELPPDTYTESGQTPILRQVF